MIIFSFLLMVAMPTAVAAWYLWNAPPTAWCRPGGSLSAPKSRSAIELLGGVADLSGSSSTDPTICMPSSQSQQMVRLVDEQLDLKAMWAKADPEIDPIFAYHPPGTIEDMLEYWERTVKVYQ